MKQSGFGFTLSLINPPLAFHPMQLRLFDLSDGAPVIRYWRRIAWSSVDKQADYHHAVRFLLCLCLYIAASA